MHLTILNTLDLVTLNRSDTDRIVSGFPKVSEGSKSSTHYLGDKNRFYVSSKGPSSGISMGEGGVGESMRVFIQVNILKQHVTK